MSRLPYGARLDGGGMCGMSPRPATRVEYRTRRRGRNAVPPIWTQIWPMWVR